MAAPAPPCQHAPQQHALELALAWVSEGGEVGRHAAVSREWRSAVRGALRDGHGAHLAHEAARVGARHEALGEPRDKGERRLCAGVWGDVQVRVCVRVCASVRVDVRVCVCK